jgi:predicted nucleic acid-binding protein
MRAVDAGVLACAVNRYVPEHARAGAVVEALANGGSPWAIAWPAAHEFMRAVTHPHAVVRPLAPADAWAYLERVLESPSLRMLGPTERHAETVAAILRGTGEEGASAPGPVDLAGIETAAILREHGVRELLSADRGMRRFAFLSVRDPLHGPEWSPREVPARRYRTLAPPRVRR